MSWSVGQKWLINAFTLPSLLVMSLIAGLVMLFINLFYNKHDKVRQGVNITV